MNFQHLTKPAAHTGAALLLLVATGIAGAGEGLPNPALTPGAVDPAVTPENIHQTICAHTRPSWSKMHRPPRKLTGRVKHEQIKLYGYDDRNKRDYEEDHLVPISIGGLSYSEPQYAHIRGADAKNLWPEPRAALTSESAEKKDELEYALWKGVCHGDISLREAQRAFMDNWIAAFDRYSALREKYRSPYAGRLGE